MKTKTRKIPHQEHTALRHKLMMVDHIYLSVQHEGVDFAMVTGDFEPTQNMAEARWLLVESPSETLILQVDGANDAILLIPSY